MSDFVPNASERATTQIKRYNQSALVHESSGPVSINITDSPLNIVAGDNARFDDGNSQKESFSQEAKAEDAPNEDLADENHHLQPVQAKDSRTSSRTVATLIEGSPGHVNITGTVNIISCENARFDDRSSIASGRDVLQNRQAANSAMENQTQDLVSKFSRINKRSWEATLVQITKDCNDEKLNEPDFQVYPQMRKVNNYYKGGYAAVEPQMMGKQQAKGILKFFRDPQQKVLLNQCIKERGFDVKRPTSEGESVRFESLLGSIMEEKKLNAGEILNITAVVASAGSGKTTLLRRLARKVMMGNDITEEHSFVAPNQSRFNVVRYIELKNVQNAESISVAEFLFGGMFENKEEVENAYRWLLNNQSKTVLFLDGLDQTQWTIGEANRVEIEPYQKASPATIMYNLMSRNLLPQLQIVLSSREFAISALQANSRPRNIVTLTGLSQDDAKKLFIALIGIDGTIVWKKLNTTSHGLLHFISIPIFLILTAVVMSRDSDLPPPDTVTGLFARVMEILPSAENIQKREKIIEILNKLKKMAHEGMLEGRVTFFEDDMIKHGLSIEDVRDLMIKVPGKNILSRYLLEKHNYILFFFHQSFQEFLSACFITEMHLREFKNFNRQSLHKYRWSVVRRFSCGLIHDENLSLREDLHKISDKKEKQKILRNSLASELQKAKEYQLLEIYASLYESNNNDLVRSTVRQITLVDTPLGPDGAHTLCSMMIRCRILDFVLLQYCEINDRLLSIMAESLKGHEVHVKIFEVYIKDFTTKGLNSLLANMTVDTLKTKIESYPGPVALSWENIGEVRLLMDPFYDISMTKTSDSVEINYLRWKFSGTFNMQDKTLQVAVQPSCEYDMQTKLIDFIQNVEKLLKQNTVTVVLKDGIPQQCVRYGSFKTALPSMLGWKFEGKVEVVDIAFDYNQPATIPVDELREELSRCGCELNIHWCYIAWKVENLRLYIMTKVSLKDLKTFVCECKVKNLTISDPKYDLLKSKERQLVQIAESSEIRLDIFERSGWMSDPQDAWKRLGQSILLLNENLRH